MGTKLNILILEDREDDKDLLLSYLASAGYQVEHCVTDTAEGMKQLLETRSFDLVISDFRMPGFSCLKALEILKESGADIPFIVTSGTIGEEAAVEVMRAGAHDIFIKGKFALLASAIERELREARNRQRLRKAESEFLQSQRLEAVGRLAGGVAHDFNNILAVVQLYSESAMQSFPPDSHAHVEMQEVLRASAKGAALVRQLLAFSRKQVLEPKELDLNQVVSGVQGMLQRLIGEHIRIEAQLDGNAGRVTVDSGQIEQLIMNLAVNARDAMPGGGCLKFSTRRLKVREGSPESERVSPGDYVVLSVSDTGHGMDEATQARIFEPFFTTKGPDQGTGLGLSTVYGIVKQSSGQITVTSALGQGTTFEIFFPWAGRTSTAGAPVQETHTFQRKGGTRILLLEDNPELRDMIRKYLEKHGYAVELIRESDGIFKLHREKAAGFALVVTDMLMPGVSGQEVGAFFESVDPRIPVLFISGFFEQGAEEFAVPEKNRFFLQKPFGSAELIRKIDQILTRKQ